MSTQVDPVRETLLAAARAAPPRSPGWRGGQAVALSLLAAIALPAILWLWGGPAHAAGRPAPVTLAVLGGSLVLALAATWLALPRPRSMLPAPRPRLAAVALGVPVLVVAGLLLARPLYADPFWRFGIQCFALTLAASPWPLAALVAATRGRDIFFPRVTGAALGAAAGAWASLTVEAWCPIADPVHVLRGHLAPLVLVALLGAVLGERLLRAPEPRRAGPLP